MAGIKDVRQNMDAPTIELGGKVRTIQFDLNAFGELEKRFGTIQNAMDQLQQGRLNDVKIILWAGLIHEEVILDEITGEPKGYNITPYQVGSWVKSPKMLREVMEVLSKAIESDMPDPENMTPVTNAAPTPEPSDSVSEGPKLATVILTEEEIAEQAKND